MSALSPTRHTLTRRRSERELDYCALSCTFYLSGLPIHFAPSYKQNKFNLLREQSEGYSKLTAELTSNLGPPHSPVTGRPTEPWSAIEERARPVWDKVISLIGYFDLDPNRALDMILDVLSVNLATHYSFFIALLSLSPWCGSYKRPTTEENIVVDSEPGLYKGKTLDEVLQLADSKPRNTASTGISARVLAQVLGFKFAYYQASRPLVSIGIAYSRRFRLSPQM